MLKIKMKRLADRGADAMQRLAAIEAAITDLADDDLLDLADIFKPIPHSPVGHIAIVEMERRKISF